MNVRITTAQPLSAPQRKTLMTALEKKYGQDLQIVEEIQEQLLGGIRVQIGSRQLDASVRGKLLTLESELNQEL